MKVVILCGGQGTRLREETEYRPKPMVPIGGKPILWHIMRIYGHYGFKEFVLCTGYKGDVIKDYFLNYRAMNNDFTIQLNNNKAISYHKSNGEDLDFTVTVADTGLHTMTGGRIKRIQPFIKDDIFLCTYGDGLATVDIGALVEFHQSHGKLATLTSVRPNSRYGVIDLDESKNVIGFNEKPKLNGWVNVGYFVFNRAIFDWIDGDETIFEQETLRRLAKENQLISFQHDGFFYAMDTYREFLELNNIWDSGDAPWNIWH